MLSCCISYIVMAISSVVGGQVKSRLLVAILEVISWVLLGQFGAIVFVVFMVRVGLVVE